MKTLLFFLALFPLFSHAQVNMESDRGGDKEGFGFATDFGFTLQGGNVRTFSYKLGLRSDLVKGKDHFYLVANSQYGEESGVSFRDQGFGHLRWTHMEGPLGFEVFTQAEFDEFRLLKVRQLNGVGIRTEFMSSLAVGISGMSDYERLNNTSQGHLDWRGSTYISLSEKVTDKFKIHLVGYYQPLFRDFADYRLYSIASISISITKKFSVKNQLTYAFDKRPPEGVEKEDAQFIVSFELKAWSE